MSDTTEEKQASINKQGYKYFLKKLKRLEIFISTVCIAGIIVCLYALQVEIYKTKDKGYIAFCDINSWISCSKVFTSRFGKGFGLMPEGWLNQPNSIYGIIFFIIQLLLLLFRNNAKALRLKIFLSVLANMGSVYLAYVLYFILGDFCIVCVSSYVINALLLVFNIKHNNYYHQLLEYNSSKKSSSSKSK